MQTPIAIYITEKQDNPVYKFNFIVFLKELFRPIKNAYNNARINQNPPPIIERYEWRNGNFMKLDEGATSSDSQALFIQVPKE